MLQQGLTLLEDLRATSRREERGEKRGGERETNQAKKVCLLESVVDCGWYLIPNWEKKKRGSEPSDGKIIKQEGGAMGGLDRTRGQRLLESLKDERK